MHIPSLRVKLVEHDEHLVLALRVLTSLLIISIHTAYLSTKLTRTLWFMLLGIIVHAVLNWSFGKRLLLVETEQE